MHIVKIKKIHIRKRTLVQWMALYLFLMPFFLNAIQSVSGSLSVLKYTLDIIWVGIGLLTLSQSKLVIQKRLVPFLVITLGFALYTVIVYAFRFQSAFYFLWGFRNNFRYYVAFFIFASLLDEADLEFGFKTMEVLFWVNVAVTFVQYFFLGYSWDYLGGIFEPFGSLSRLKQNVNGKTRNDHRALMDGMIRLYSAYKDTLEKKSMGFMMSDWDGKLLKYGAMFEKEMMDLSINIPLESALDLGWKILSECFNSEETGIKSELIEQYWPKK